MDPKVGEEVLEVDSLFKVGEGACAPHP